MKTSLEEERRALLEHIEASRHVYRRMLSGETAGPLRTLTHGSSSRRSTASVNQKIGQWVSDHPLQVATGVTLLVYLAPGLLRRIRHRPKSGTKATASGTGTGKAIAAVLMLLLQNPRRLEKTVSVLTMAWHWLHRKTPTPNPISGRTSYA